MYQIEDKTIKRTVPAAEAICHHLTESLSSIYAVTRLSTMLGLPADTVAKLLAPLGVLKGQEIDPTRLDSLLLTAKALEVVEEYAITQEPHCLGLPLTVEAVGPEGLSVRVELPSGWLVELDLPGAALASEERVKRKWTNAA
ncbi:MAG: hypothetical protein CVU60_06260 [Deltaproteobacteria bacterium HGW-Deltaproteobacteria-18]|nr:MAG: hypothetical protein CVU60_06260 [Deltaproteobacteria bacterium HGW-Deltaproteobacteria-18]